MVRIMLHISKGGRIDAAHHNGHAVRALSETLAFDKAIEVKLELLTWWVVGALIL